MSLRIVGCFLSDSSPPREHTLPHLLFWSSVRAQVLRNEADWLVGTLVEQPQHSDPTRTVYLITADETIDYAVVGRHIDAVDAAAQDAVQSTAPFGG